MPDEIDTILADASLRSKLVGAVGLLNKLTDKLERYVDVEERKVELGAECSEGEFDALEKVETDMEGLRNRLVAVQRILYGGKSR